MKKTLLLMIAAVGILSSCTTSLMSFYTEDVNPYNERVYYNYYTDDYYFNNQPVVYVDRVFYVQHWDSYSGRWYREILPEAYWGYVIPTVTHNPYLGGRWVRTEPRYQRPYGAPSDWNYNNYRHNYYRSDSSYGDGINYRGNGWRIGEQRRNNNENRNSGIRGTQNHGTNSGTFGGARRGVNNNGNTTITQQRQQNMTRSTKQQNNATQNTTHRNVQQGNQQTTTNNNSGFGEPAGTRKK